MRVLLDSGRMENIRKRIGYEGSFVVNNLGHIGWGLDHVMAEKALGSCDRFFKKLH